MNGNFVHMVGNLVRDPELRYTASEKAVCNFSIARSWKIGEGDETRAEFFDCVVWEAQAEHFAVSVRKGDRVMIEGTLRQRKWLDQAGNTRSKVEIVADNVGPALIFAEADVVKVIGPNAGREPALVGAQADDADGTEVEDGEEPF